MATLKQNASGLIPVDLSKDIVHGVAKGSSIMRLSRLEEMQAAEKKISVLNGVQAYFVDEAGKIPTEDAQFVPVTLKTKKLAVIVPFSSELMNESIVNVIKEIQPDIVEQFYRKFDNVALNGGIYEKSLMGAINGTGQYVNIGATAGNGLDGDVSDTMALIEAHGYDSNGFVTHFGMKNNLRKLKDANGTPLYQPVTGTASDELYGQPIEFSFGVDKASTELVTGDFRHSIVGVRGDIEYKLLTEATVGNYNLAEQDMVALRAIMHVAYTITKDDAFAALKKA